MANSTKFKVLELDVINEVAIVFAKQVTSKDFKITPTSQLSGVGVKFLTQPRKLNSDGSLIYNYWAFHLKNKNDLAKFSTNSIVDLVC